MYIKKLVQTAKDYNLKFVTYYDNLVNEFVSAKALQYKVNI